MKKTMARGLLTFGLTCVALSIGCNQIDTDSDGWSDDVEIAWGYDHLDDLDPMVGLEEWTPKDEQERLMREGIPDCQARCICFGNAADTSCTDDECDTMEDCVEGKKPKCKWMAGKKSSNNADCEQTY